MLDNLAYPFIIGTMRLGKWGAYFSLAEYERFIEACLDLELNCFDHADIYGGYTTEEEFGAVLKRRHDLKKRVKVISKCGIRMFDKNRPEHRIKSYDTSALHIRKSVERSLQNLGLDCLDMLLIHRPDHLLDPAEVADIVSQLQKEGKIKAFGVSNFSTNAFELLNAHIPVATNQIELSLNKRRALNDGTLLQCMQHKIRPTIWSPLDGGILMQKPLNPNLENQLKTIGSRHRITRFQLMFKWILMHPSKPIPVLGSSKIERIKEARNTIDTQMSREEWYELLEAASGHEVA